MEPPISSHFGKSSGTKRTLLLVLELGVCQRFSQKMGLHNQFRIMVACSLAWTALAAEPPPLDPQVSVQVEALNRLKGIDLEANAAVKGAVLKVIEKTRGTAAFVDLVQDFAIAGQNEALLDFALTYPAHGSAPVALKRVFEDNGSALIERAAGGTNAAAVLQVLAKVPDKRVLPLLESGVTNSAIELPARKLALQGLVRTQEGARGLIAMAREDRLPLDLKLAAASELQLTAWPEIKKEVGEVLPLPQSSGEPLPPISELVKLSGNSQLGAAIYRRQEVGCINCHQVHGEGTDFGPKLSEIGTKLGKEALYEAILDPSSGISFGYEAWSVETTEGDELFGLLVSETADELAIKTQNGLVNRVKKSNVARKQMMKTSIMPAGLQLTMTKPELVDLIEYLTTLKKKD